MPNLTSPALAIFANKATPSPVDTWNPLTGALPARDLNAVKFGVWLGAITNLNVQPAYQFSDDGVDWSGPVYKKAMTVGSATKTTEEWTWGDQTTFFAVPGAGETGGGYVRFGVVASTASTKDTEYAQARIYVAWRTVNGSSLDCAPTRVWTNNTNVFVALTGPLPADDVAEARAELEVSGMVSAMTLKPAYQQVDDPGVDTNWGTAVEIRRAAHDERVVAGDGVHGGRAVEAVRSVRADGERDGWWFGDLVVYCACAL